MNDDKKIVDLGNLWLINGNYFTKEFCKGDLDLAKKYAETLIDCFDCVDCRNCVNCNHCARCDGCKDCEHCISCISCDRCLYCFDCVNCSECKNVAHMNRIKVKNTPMTMRMILP